MADNTKNYGLVKPAGSEKADISVINDNMDKIDAALTSMKNADELLDTILDDELSRMALAEQTLGCSVKNLMKLDDFSDTLTEFKYPKIRPLKAGSYTLTYKVNEIGSDPQEWRWKNAEGTVIKSVLTKNDRETIKKIILLNEDAVSMDVYFNGGGSYSEFMLRRSEILSDTYEPFKPSVEERLAALEERLNALEGGAT